MQDPVFCNFANFLTFPQPRPQSAFPWPWRWAGKAREKHPGDEVDIPS